VLSYWLAPRPPQTVSESWDVIEAWLGERAPHLSARLPRGATDDAIDLAACALSVQWPDEVRESLRRHDGTGGAAIFNGLELLSLDQIIETWKGLTDLLRGGSFRGVNVSASRTVRPVWWNDAWIPCTADVCGNHECIDLDALTPESSGQVVWFQHDGDTRDVIAPSFRAWLSDHARRFKDGTYSVDGDSIGEV
jgi:cell wall assembly regulator SMI1